MKYHPYYYEEKYERGKEWCPMDFMPYNFPDEDQRYWLNTGLMVRHKIPFLRAEVYKWVRKKR